MMPTAKIRRLLRHGILAVSAMVVLVGSYISAWLAVSLAAQDGDIPRPALEASIPLFVPIVRYCELGLPGGNGLSRLWYTVIERVESAEDEEIEIMIGFGGSRFAPPSPTLD